MKDIKVQSLLTDTISKSTSKVIYNTQKKVLDRFFKIAKQNQKEKHVLRYIAEIDLENNTLEVKLVSVPVNSNFGLLKAGEHLIEFYTLNNGTTPVLIQGAAFGKQNTAKIILNDILKIAERKRTAVYS